MKVAERKQNEINTKEEEEEEEECTEDVQELTKAQSERRRTLELFL